MWGSYLWPSLEGKCALLKSQRCQPVAPAAVAIRSIALDRWGLSQKVRSCRWKHCLSTYFYIAF